LRKFIITALVAGSCAAAGLVAAPAFAEPSGACAGGPGGVVTQPGAPGGTSGGIAVCVPGTGAVSANGDAGGPSGSLVADGDSGNQAPANGYVGVHSDGSSLQVVGECGADYSGSDTTPLFDTNNPTAQPTAPGAACGTPAAP